MIVRSSHCTRERIKALATLAQSLALLLRLLLPSVCLRLLSKSHYKTRTRPALSIMSQATHVCHHSNTYEESRGEMVPIDLSSAPVYPPKGRTNGINGHKLNGVNGHNKHNGLNGHKLNGVNTPKLNGVKGENGNVPLKTAVKQFNPYAPQYADFLSNVSNFNIIESTLREGEQFANAFFDTETKIKIAKALDAFGVEYIELTSPAASEQSRADCEAICKLGLRAKILTHIRCHMDDARIAVETGVDGVNVVIGTSSFLREFSHGKDMAYITCTAIEVIEFVKSKGIEVRFSSEDSFRSDLVDLLSIYQTVDKIGVNRVGIADTVGCANPRQVYDLVRTLRGVVSCDIEIHLHNDTGCAIANAFCALEAGATHIDTSVLGIGERVGITPLGGLIACLYAANPEYVKAKYNLPALRELENLVAEAVEVSVPFCNPITGYCAFTHKAGIHAKAILNNPSTYEILKPGDFGLTRYVSIGHRLTGWNAVKSRVEQLQLKLTDDQIKDVTAKIKELADVRTQSMEDVDTLLRVYHSGVESGELELGQRHILDRLLEKHRSQSPERVSAVAA
ncbi:homocitrate synthase [Calocera viscosa TUFC12733]|uniref:homocitrate synthase n=1 Tax=Calocera viscosa (strain TUFC12733) TaxID=1330018 RepID=A0A167HFC2_CALVF|nr:homocitrate synthase [Calocera viscosa TUFC12733]